MLPDLKISTYREIDFRIRRKKKLLKRCPRDDVAIEKKKQTKRDVSKLIMVVGVPDFRLTYKP